MRVSWHQHERTVNVEASIRSTNESPHLFWSRLCLRHLGNGGCILCARMVLERLRRVMTFWVRCVPQPSVAAAVLLTRKMVFEVMVKACVPWYMRQSERLESADPPTRIRSVWSFLPCVISCRRPFPPDSLSRAQTL